MSKDSLYTDPKSDLKFFIQELEQFKKQRLLFQIQLKAEELHGYLNTINIPYVTRHHLQGYLVLVATQAHSLHASQIAREDPEHLEKQFYHVERPLNDVIISIESILRNPKNIIRKVIKKENKKTNIIKKLFGNNSQQKQLSDEEKPLEFDVSHEDYTGKIKVFISHKFVESDQKLAATLQKSLDKHNIYGYLAERKKEYDLVFGEKMKKNIESSDYLIAIITKNSHNAPSVHQEIGYALGVKVPVRIMAEEQEAKGVLIEGRDMEKFSRQNFEKYLANIIKDVIKNGKRKKLTDKEKEELIQNVYEPCYNQIMNIYEKTDFLTELPPNPWKDKISHRWKLRTELEIKDLFEEYTKILETWKKIFVERENDYSQNKLKLEELITPAFEKAGLMNGSMIQLDSRSSMAVKDWFHAFRFVLLDPTTTNASILYEKLLDFARKTNNGHEKWLEQFNAKTDLFRNIMNLMPEIIDKFYTEIPEEQLVSQRQKLREIIEKLKIVLEEKLK